MEFGFNFNFCNYYREFKDKLRDYNFQNSLLFKCVFKNVTDCISYEDFFSSL